MRKFCSILNVNLKNNLQSISLLLVYLGISLICTAFIGVIGTQSFINPAIKSGSATSKLLNYIVGLLGYCTAFVVTGISYSTLFSTPLIREKIRGNIEYLLATSTDIRIVWLAKSIALYIPGLIMGVVFSIILTTVINIFYLAPNFTLSLNPWITACTYIALPIIYFFLSLLMNLIGLIEKTVNAGAIGIVFVVSSSTLMINLAARNTVNANSGLFFIINLALAGILIIFNIIFKNKLKAERIVLSCGK